MQSCCYFPLIVLYVLWEEVMVPSGFKSCSEPCAVMFLSLFLSLSFSHISNGRRHAGSQHGGEWWHRRGRGCVSHLISVPMETDGWRIPLPLTCNLWRLGQRLVALPTYCTCHAQRFSPLLSTETATPASLLLLPLLSAVLTLLEQSCQKKSPLRVILCLLLRLLVVTWPQPVVTL